MILFFDTETTGKLDYRADPLADCQPNLVQLAAMMANEGARVLAQINFIIEPNGWEIPEEVSRIHGISNKLAASAGVPRRIALASFNNLCKRASKIVAHNFDFDYAVLLVNYHRDKAPHRMDHLRKICTMKASTPVLKLPKPFRGKPGDLYKWPTLTEAFAYYFDGATFDGAHNAMNDVTALANVYWEMVKRGQIK